MRIASYRKSQLSILLGYIGKVWAHSVGTGCVFLFAVNQLIDKGKLIVRWGRKARGSIDVIVDSLAAEVNGLLLDLFPPPLHCVPRLRSVRLIEKGERNDKTYA